MYGRYALILSFLVTSLGHGVLEFGSDREASDEAAGRVPERGKLAFDVISIVRIREKCESINWVGSMLTDSIEAGIGRILTLGRMPLMMHLIMCLMQSWIWWICSDVNS